MFSFTRRKKVIVRCFTTMTGLPEMFPISRLSKITPTWWRETPAYGPEHVIDKDGKTRHTFMPAKTARTIKHCYALQKLWERGICIPAWSELTVNIMTDGKAHGVAPAQSKFGSQHPVLQYPGMITPDWVNWKAHSPWLIYTERYVSFYVSDPFYHNKSHQWMTMPGVIEFYHQHHSNVNMMFRTPGQGTMAKYDLPAGEMLCYLIPMFDEDFEIVCETVSKEEYEKLEWAKKFSFRPAKFTRDQEVGGCPFHKGEMKL